MSKCCYCSVEIKPSEFSLMPFPGISDLAACAKCTKEKFPEMNQLNANLDRLTGVWRGGRDSNRHVQRRAKIREKTRGPK